MPCRESGMISAKPYRRAAAQRRPTRCCCYDDQRRCCYGSTIADSRDHCCSTSRRATPGDVLPWYCFHRCLHSGYLPLLQLPCQMLYSFKKKFARFADKSKREKGKSLAARHHQHTTEPDVVAATARHAAETARRQQIRGNIDAPRAAAQHPALTSWFIR